MMRRDDDSLWADFKANALELMNDENPNAPPEGEINNPPVLALNPQPIVQPPPMPK